MQSKPHCWTRLSSSTCQLCDTQLIICLPKGSLALISNPYLFATSSAWNPSAAPLLAWPPPPVPSSQGCPDTHPCMSQSSGTLPILVFLTAHSFCFSSSSTERYCAAEVSAALGCELKTCPLPAMKMESKTKSGLCQLFK